MPPKAIKVLRRPKLPSNWKFGCKSCHIVSHASAGSILFDYFSLLSIFYELIWMWFFPWLWDILILGYPNFQLLFYWLQVWTYCWLTVVVLWKNNEIICKSKDGLWYTYVTRHNYCFLYDTYSYFQRILKQPLILPQESSRVFQQEKVGVVKL